MIDERLEVADVAFRPVVHHRRPLALAVAALIERETVALATKTEAHEIPRVGVEPATVEEDDRRTARRPPVEIVEAHPAEHDVVRVGQRELGKTEPGFGRRPREVLTKLGLGQTHPRSLTSFCRLRNPGGWGPRRPQFVNDTSPT